jgi:RNA polymerase sigma-70 factor (ECF subfamily)
VDDLVNDTYLKLFANNCRALRELVLTHENAIFGFLMTVASNVVMDHFRSSRNKKRWSGKDDLSLDDVIFVAAKIGSAKQAEREIIIQEIDRILKQELANEPNFARDYAIFWLYFRDGFTAKAISKLTGIGLTVKGVESTLLRLTKLVRPRMSRAARQ